MENQILLVFSLFPLIFFNSANAICVPRHLADLEVLDQPPFILSSSNKSNPPSSQPLQNSSPSIPTPSPSIPNPSPAGTDLPVGHIAAPSGSIAGSFARAFSGSIHGLMDAIGGGTLHRPEVQNICQKTDYPSLCASVLNPVFNGNADPINIIELMIKAASQQTKAAMDKLSEMAAKPDQKTAAAAYADCKDAYDDALDNLQDALDAIPGNDIPTVQTMLSAAITDYSTCDDDFTGQPDPDATGVSPMAAIDENLMNMVDNVLAIAKAIN